MGTQEPPCNNALFESGYWVLDADARARHQRKQIEYIRKIRSHFFVRRYILPPKGLHFKRRHMGTRRLALLPNRAAIWVHVAANVLNLFN